MNSERALGGEKNYTEAEFGRIFYRYLLENGGKEQLPEFTDSFLEISGPVGVADILTLNMQSSAVGLGVLAAKLSGMPRATVSYLLSRLSRSRKVPIASLVDKSPLNRKTTSATLNAMVSAEVLAKKDGSVRLAKTFEIPDATVCFFEIKMKNWQRATFQAAQALAYSDYAYCVMPIKMLRIVEKQKPRLRSLGVGMVVFDPEAMVAKTVVKAVRRGPKRKSAKIEMLLRFSEQAFPRAPKAKKPKPGLLRRIIRFFTG